MRDELARRIRQRQVRLVLRQRALVVANVLAQVEDVLEQRRVEATARHSKSGNNVTLRAESKAMAERLRDRLVELGAPSGQIEAIGAGESEPIANEADESGREKNRRVELNLRPR